MRLLILIFLLMALAGGATGHGGVAMLCLLWVLLCTWATKWWDAQPVTVGCGVVEKDGVEGLNLQSREILENQIDSCIE